MAHDEANTVTIPAGDGPLPAGAWLSTSCRPVKARPPSLPRCRRHRQREGRHQPCCLHPLAGRQPVEGRRGRMDRLGSLRMSFLLQRQGVVSASSLSMPISPPDYEILATEMTEGARLQDRSEWDYESNSDATSDIRWILAETHSGKRCFVPSNDDRNARALCMVSKRQNVRVRGWIEAQEQPNTGSVSCRLYLKMAGRAPSSSVPRGIICRVIRFSSGLPAWQIIGTNENDRRREFYPFSFGCVHHASGGIRRKGSVVAY
jgi:hypothetical protein